MWQDGQDSNEDGTPVRLYQPILYSKRLADDATVSHIGGTPTYFDSDAKVSKTTPHCSSCKEEMMLLLQLYNPDTERTLYVFGCNKGSCVAAAFGESQFSLGGGGRFVSRHSQPGEEIKVTEEKAMTEQPSTTTDAVESSPWGTDDTNNGDDNNGDWDVTDGDDDNVDDVEAMVAAMEMEGNVIKVEKKKSCRAKQSQNHDDSSSSLPCFEIHSLQEPPRPYQDVDDDDEDDTVGVMGASGDKHIQELLARYLQEEEDPDILAALQGSATGGGRIGEQEEQLPPEDRAMLAFTNRVKRSPRQIVRYARGGIPMWSVPFPAEPKTASNHRKSTIQEMSSTLLKVPNCPCGEERQFECQLMPNLLGVLDVDKHHARQCSTFNSNNIHQLMSRDHGGMNWGAIAIYTCRDSNCNACREDYVIVQDSTDGTPEMRRGEVNDAMVVEEEDYFDEDEDDFDK